MLFLPECFSFLGASQQESLSNAQPLEGPLMRRYCDLAKRTGLWLSLGGFQVWWPRRPAGRPAVVHAAWAGRAGRAGRAGAPATRERDRERAHGASPLPPLQEKGPDPDHMFNCHVVISSSGAVAAAYRKVHLFDVDVPNG
jgi:predicted amidohydrolase